MKRIDQTKIKTTKTEFFEQDGIEYERISDIIDGEVLVYWVGVDNDDKGEYLEEIYQSFKRQEKLERITK